MSLPPGSVNRTGDRVVGVCSKEPCPGTAGVGGCEVLVSLDRSVVGCDSCLVVAVACEDGALSGGCDRVVWCEGDREVVDPGSPDNDEDGDREPEPVGDTPDRALDDEAESDQEQRCGEDGEHCCVLGRAGVPGDPCGGECLLFEYLALCIESEWPYLAEKLLGGELLSAPGGPGGSISARPPVLPRL